MNTEAYDNAWTELLSARRSGDLLTIQQCAERLAHETRLLLLDIVNPEDICDHKYNLNGYCIACGFHPVKDNL